MTNPIKNKTPETGLRYNLNKPKFNLIDPLAMQGLAQVLTKGAIKYAPNNWRKGLSISETIGSLERHLNAIKSGEVFDKESGEQHIDHIGCNWMFLSHFLKTGTGDHDLPPAARWKINKVKPPSNNG